MQLALGSLRDGVRIWKFLGRCKEERRTPEHSRKRELQEQRYP